MAAHLPRLRVAMIGHGFMGAAHSQGWRVAPRFFDLPVQPEMAVLVGRNGEAAEAAATTWGWAESSSNWRETVARDDIDVVDIVTPGSSHVEMAITALEHGKHVLCEKPLANSVAEAEAMVRSARRAATNGVVAMVGFTYRRVPAVTFARDLVAAGRIGTVRQVRVSYLQDWLADESSPVTWRLDKQIAGSGALGDIGAHAIDAAQFITGLNLVAVSGILETLVTERPLAAASGAAERSTRSGAAESGATASGAGSGSGIAGQAGTGVGAVTVDDIALFTGRFDTGVLGSFEASRFSTGRKNSLRIEVSGSSGALAFDLEDLNALQFYDRAAGDTVQGFTRIIVTEPQHPYISSWWPSGHMLGYENGFSNQVADFVTGVSTGVQPLPSFEDGLQVQRVLSSVERSSSNGSAWTPVEAVPPDHPPTAGWPQPEKLKESA